MHPGATLFLDVCVQSDLWPEGVWPLVTRQQAGNVERLFGLAESLAVRQGGIVCRHAAGSFEPPAGSPAHCQALDAANRRPSACLPQLPILVWDERADRDPATTLGRDHAIYVDSGCCLSPDDGPWRARAFTHLTSGVRDAVVFGAGVERGLAHAVDALLRRRIRTHVALDAVGAVDETAGQTIVAVWKRRGVDGITVETLARLLGRR